MNVKRAVAAAAGVLGTLILVVAMGVGYLAGHSSARTGATTVSHSSTHSAAPVKATLDAIYGDSTSTPGIYGDGNGVSPGIYGDGNGVSSGTTSSTTTSTSGNTITVTPTGGTGTGITPAIFGD